LCSTPPISSAMAQLIAQQTENPVRHDRRLPRRDRAEHFPDIGARDSRGLEAPDLGHDVPLDDPLVREPGALALLRVLLKEALGELLDGVGAARLPDRLCRVNTLLCGSEGVLGLVARVSEPEPLCVEGAERHAALRPAAFHPVAHEPGPATLG
jgi:hypothetical protein